MRTGGSVISLKIHGTVYSDFSFNPIKEVLTIMIPTVETAHVDSKFNSECFNLSFRPRISALSSKMIGVEEVIGWSRDGSNWIDVTGKQDFSDEDFARIWCWKLLQFEKYAVQFKKWKKVSGDGKCNFFISMKLSPKLLLASDWATQLLDTLSRSEIPGYCVEVCLMEHDIAWNASIVEWSFEMLRQAGVKILFDNFAGSRLCFQRLVRYRFDKVKIDKLLLPSVTESVGVWSRKRLVLSGLISVINSLGINEILLDGIEKDTQLNFFRTLTATEWQGAYWGDEITFDELISIWMRENYG